MSTAGLDDRERMERLRRLLGGPELAELRGRLRARYERGETRDAFTLSGLGATERRALEALLGRDVRPAATMRLTRSALDAAVRRAGLAETFRDALEALEGPLTDRRALRIEQHLAWQRALGEIRDSRLDAAVSDAAGIGVLKRLAGGDPEQGKRMLDDAERVLARLPARGEPLARLAADTLGDAHALDEGRPVAALVLRACGGSGDELFGSDQREGEREPRRARWASVGVTVNELAAPALVLNLRGRGSAEAARLANAAAELGSPVHLSLRSLLRSEPDWEFRSGVVHVCENSSVVAIAADSLAGDCAPLVCTDGMPGAAQQTLLRQLVAAGARLRYHGDFDWPGIGIGNFVIREFGAEAWRFSADDYRAARADVGLRLAQDRRVPAVWDDRLAEAMEERGIAVHEEGVVETLLSDLGAALYSRA